MPHFHLSMTSCLPKLKVLPSFCLAECNPWRRDYFGMICKGTIHQRRQQFFSWIFETYLPMSEILLHLANRGHFWPLPPQLFHLLLAGHWFVFCQKSAEIFYQSKCYSYDWQQFPQQVIIELVKTQYFPFFLCFQVNVLLH